MRSRHSCRKAAFVLIWWVFWDKNWKPAWYNLYTDTTKPSSPHFLQSSTRSPPSAVMPQHRCEGKGDGWPAPPHLAACITTPGWFGASRCCLQCQVAARLALQMQHRIPAVTQSGLQKWEGSDSTGKPQETPCLLPVRSSCLSNVA